MSVRPRLRTRGGCATCKRRRKKCDEQKPICGACQRLFLKCSWTSEVTQPESQDPVVGTSHPSLDRTTPRLRHRSTVPKSVDLSAFRGQVCAAHVLETCFKATNLPTNATHTAGNGLTMQATLCFAPIDTSLAWNCIVALGLFFVGHRYQDQSLVNAADVQRAGIVSKVRLAVESGVQSIDYDTLAGICLLGPIGVMRFWFGMSNRGDEGILHGLGLSAVIEAMQPEQFQAAHALALFEYMRFTIVMAPLLSGQHTQLVSEPWRTIPWAQAKHKKGSMQVLLDLLCDMVPLQSEKTLTYSGPDRPGLMASSTCERVARLLLDLSKWRRAFGAGLSDRLKILDSAGQSSLAHTGAEYPIQFERPDDLFQLGLFNMMLIYVCRFLGDGSVLAELVHSTAQMPTVSGFGLIQGSILPTTPLILPIGDPVARARVAAKEIYTIWKCLTKDGLFGCGSFYLTVPLVVAKVHLLQEGDTEGTDISEALNRIPAMWAGRR